MSLTGQQLGQISDAIRRAYTPDALTQIVRVRLGERLYDVAGGEDFTAVVFHLVEWAARQGRLAELVHAAQVENAGNSELTMIAAEFGPPAVVNATRLAGPIRWYVPFERCATFFGRAEDLERLHTLLTGRASTGGQAVLGVRPVGVTGMGGIGKTQLVVEYSFRHRADYPGGVYWLNGAADWPTEFASLGAFLDPGVAGQAQEIQIQAATNYLQTRTDCLLVLDGVDDPQQLRQPVTRFLVPSALCCAVLFTTRWRDLGDDSAVELTVLQEEPGLQLLLRHPGRRDTLRVDHPDHDEAVAIYRILGGLPLALEIAGAHLGRRPAARLTAYRQDLLQRGALAVVDDSRGGVRDVDLGTRHAAAVAATLTEQWEGLGEDARLLLRVAGQLPVAATVPRGQLGLLAGLRDEGADFFSSPLANAATELIAVSLLEDLRGDLVRLHPLVREYAAQQTSPAESAVFRSACAGRLITAYSDVAVLEEQCARRRIDAVEQDLMLGLDWLDATLAAETVRPVAQVLLRMVRQESHIIRNWDAKRNPGLFCEQWLKRAVLLHDENLCAQARAFLYGKPPPNLEVVWTTAHSGLSLVRTLAGRSSGVSTVAMMPNGRHVISGSYGDTLQVWDLATGETVRILSGHEREVYAVAVTPDSRYAISGSYDKTLRVWDLASGETLHVLRGHEGGVRAIAVTPDGHQALSGSSDRTLRLWDLDTGAHVQTLTGHGGAVSSVAVTPTGSHIVSGSFDMTVRVWDRASGTLVHTLTGHDGAVSSVAVTQDGQNVISGAYDRTLRVWDLASGEFLRTLVGHEREVLTVAVTPDGRLAVSGSYDRMMRVWNTNSGECIHILAGHEAGVSAVATAPGGWQAVSGSFDTTVRVWDLATGETARTFDGHISRVSSLAIMPDGLQAVSASYDTTLRIWDIGKGQTIRVLTGHTDLVHTVVLTPDGLQAISGSLDMTVRVWNLVSGANVRALAGHTLGVLAVAITPSGRFVVSGSYDKTLRVWDLVTGQSLHTLEGHSREVSCVAITPDGRHAISGSADKTLRMWDLASGACLNAFDGHSDGVTALSLTPDGRYAVSGAWDNTLQVWNLATGKVMSALIGHTREIHAVTITPDGRHAISGSGDNTLRVWDLTTATEKAHIVLDAAISSVALAEHGHIIVAGDASGNLYRLRYWE